MLASCSAAIFVCPAIGATAQAAGIDAICTAQASISLSAPLDNNTVGGSVAGTVSNCVLSGGLTGGTLTTTSPLSISGCYPLFSVTGDTLQLAWNNGTTSTLRVGVNFNLLTGLPSLTVTVIAGTFAGDTMTPLPIPTADGLCGVAPTTALQVPLAVVVFTS